MTTILVIEDEKAIHRNLLKLLNAEGFETLSADNGRIGVKLAQTKQPDLIICDILMPGLDGYGVLKILQQHPLTATIPFIFLTAKTEQADIRQGMTLGADDYVTKPFTRAQILSAIAARLQKVKLRQQQSVINPNLPNRQLLQRRFNQLETQGNQSKLQIFLLSLEIEQLNQLNNTLGLAIGDQLLQAVVERLRRLLGQQDTIAQIDSDHFIILLSRSYHKPESIQIVETLLKAFDLPFQVDSHKIFLSAYIGIAILGRDGRELDTLIRHASVATEEAKQSGNRRYQFYIASIGAKSQAAFELEIQMRQALERQEFQLYYQPKVNLLTGQIEGAEALVRWNHPQRGIISPVEFIPLAEKTGLIVPLGEWVLRQACHQARLWQDQGIYPLRIAVNLSPRQFNQSNLTNFVVDILHETGLNPHYLELELTESTLVQNPEAAIATLQRFKALGIRISIDDFGTGYSALSQLKKFPFDVLKIDRSFVCQLTEDSRDEAITTAILQMARSLKLKVVAEGVETLSQLNFFKGHQCDEIQGYWFSPPLSAEAFAELLSTGNKFPLLSS
ncbi:EAL domain-containing response regulator [Coleofasciculus sp.]|uniref:EAL domain-containing response regulator n=1 Tax=Coleofasciculus sp. TaxID=3100458 RepID=UPI003A3D1957